MRSIAVRSGGVPLPVFKLAATALLACSAGDGAPLHLGSASMTPLGEPRSVTAGFNAPPLRPSAEINFIFDQFESCADLRLHSGQRIASLEFSRSQTDGGKLLPVVTGTYQVFNPYELEPQDAGSNGEVREVHVDAQQFIDHGLECCAGVELFYGFAGEVTITGIDGGAVSGTINVQLMGRQVDSWQGDFVAAIACGTR